MKRKYLALALAVLALSGCGSDNSRDTARVPTPGDGGGDINTGQPVDSIYYSAYFNANKFVAWKFTCIFHILGFYG